MTSHDLSPLLRYPLLVPHIAYLCIKYRMLPSDIIHANPALPQGGLPFSPKDEILDRFSGALPYTVVRTREPLKERVKRGIEFAEKHGWPCIVKPNSGHRGIDIHLSADADEMENILKRQTWDYQLQKYCPYTHEFGVFYCRMPGDDRGSIVSLTQKVIPVITGDGSADVEALIDRGDIVNKKAVKEAMSARLHEIPSAGENIVTLVGASHSRGSIFLDASHLETQALAEKVHEFCSVDGFYFGRLDVRAESVEAFQAGRFEVIEVNGATSEMIHVYDNRISFSEGLRILKRQWSLLFKIASRCRDASRRIPFLRFLWMYRSFYLSTKQAIGKLW